jgi:hypothetical protein
MNSRIESKLKQIRYGFCEELGKIDDEITRIRIARGIAAIDDMLSWKVL